MKANKLCGLVVALLLCVVPAVRAASAGIPVRGIATVSEHEVILDVFADTGGVPLLSFGFSATYDPNELAFTSGGRYGGLWFMRGENGVSYAYTDVTLPSAGVVRVVGARFDGNHPGEGIAGDHLLLATLVFKRLSGNAPGIGLGLAEPPPFANFVTVEGENLDEGVEPQMVEVQVASEDTDGDGLPDDYERDTFGSLLVSNGEGDTDGDGDPDGDEWVRGTDPTDPDSKFVLRVIPQPDDTKIVLWTGHLGRVYDLEWSGGLGSFDLIGVGLPGVEPEVERLDDVHNGDAKGFYRVITHFPTMGR